MKQELHHYAISLRSRNLSNIPIICVWILLAIFLIPLVLSNIVFGLLLLFTYSLLYLCSKKEGDKYNSELLNLGLFLLFLGIEFSALAQIQYRIIVYLVATISIFLISYEILFFIKIKKKMYSKSMEHKSPWAYITPMIFGGTGIWLGRLIARSKNIDLMLWIVILLSSMLITYSFTLFQKYFINKIIN